MADLTGAFGGSSKMGESIKHLEVKLFLSNAPPLFKVVAVGDGKAAEKVALIEIDCLT